MLIFSPECTYMFSVLHNHFVVFAVSFSEKFISKNSPTLESHFFKILLNRKHDIYLFLSYLKEYFY